MPHGPPPTAGDQFQLVPTVGVAAIMAWWRVLEAWVVQLGHRAGAATAGRQPSRTPRQSRPAGIVVACCVSGGAALHRPLGLPQPVQLRCQRPGAVLQVLQVAVAVEGPAVDAASPAAPIAGLRGARTGVVGRWPTGASMALVDPRSGREADLPGPTGRPAGHQVSPPLAWLPGSNQPAKPAGTAQPEPHCMSTVRPDCRACRARSGCGRRPEGRRVLDHHFPASPTTSNPSSCSRARPTPGRGVVVDDQHGLGHRLIVARAEGASHRGYPWFPIPTRQHPSMLRRCRGRTAGPLKELRRLRRGSSPTLGMQESV
jgi:hypothetical protein